MSKIKVVQIAMAAASEMGGSPECYTEYLDDKGRVWYLGGHYEEIPPTTADGSSGRRWISEWKQLELPEEPTV